MANSNSLHLYEKVELRNTLHRVIEFIILFLLLSLLVYRLLSFNNHKLSWSIAFLCELWFTFSWVITMSNKWNLVDHKPYPDRLLQRVPKDELPAVDLFVTTADPELEPPIITVNTVLSLLAVEYPTDKLACYVSDDGCSPITFYSLVEASKFAKIWVPFCKKYNVQVRAPFRYFTNNSKLSGNNNNNSSMEFKHEWKMVKDEYEQLSSKIEDVVRKSVNPSDIIDGDFLVFSNVQRNNHPTIIKVVWENKEAHSNRSVPHLVYISREKRPKRPHHAKAGAMNVLTRVSGLMTNAPYMLNVDCDMFASSPNIILHAMCMLLGSKNENENAFVQCPQVFYGGLKDDPFGNHMVVLWKYVAHGISGIQGPFYSGTGCVHRRRVIYGLSPNYVKVGETNAKSMMQGKSVDEELLDMFGKEFTKSAADALNGKAECSNMLTKTIEAACLVAGVGYEYGTQWGKKVGWMYGSTTEDILTGLSIHNKGWRSILYAPDPPAFLGCAPTGGPASMTQQKRWATGLLEILLSKNCPIFGTLFANLQFRQCLAYFWILSWGLRSVPELCYAALPAYSIITNSHFLPKGPERAYYIPISVFLFYNLYTLLEYLRTSLSIRAWWNNQRMGRITTMSAWLFGFLGVILKLLGISETVFEVTRKDQSTSSDEGTEDTEAGKFTFDQSPVFVPPTAMLFMQLTALATALLRLQPPARDGVGSGSLETMCSVLLVVCLLPFLKGLFGSGKYGIPMSTIFKSAGLALLFYTLCRY
ncbi:putative cellulose synthase (UDP-forming) [Rosa chinensis]|uniref:Putative cellulose synthase (UDP-forming) n=1 Tax=Rosa chinensis TaxID=74649 RepID=A0A2P6S254_ROSCH|nr:cellulose synthase-like protein H1 [Rosa chinensis]XP_040370073.1 cellulose synthase-like protein H1 [Rosa chinensis]PRQ52741.1 putative cellulose synthase (UDP-forming) [Rosa chinensis]